MQANIAHFVLVDVMDPQPVAANPSSAARPLPPIPIPMISTERIGSDISPNLTIRRRTYA